MSLGALKKSLFALNLLAVLGLAGTAFGFLRLKGELASPPRQPDFEAPVKPVSTEGGSIDAIDMPLGIVPDKTKNTPQQVKPEVVESLPSVLARYGDIENATVVYPPYTGGVGPAITFRKHDTGKTVTIGLNESLETRPNPDPNGGSTRPIPVHYKFIGCRPDPDHPGWTYFRFDVNLDGKDIQEAQWKGETKQAGLPTAPGAPSPDLVTASGDGIWIGLQSVYDEQMSKDIKQYAPVSPGTSPATSPASSSKAPAGKGETPASKESAGPGKQTQTVDAHATETAPKTTTVNAEPDRPAPTNTVTTNGTGNTPAPQSSLFEKEEGVDYAPTEAGVRYLKDNYQSVMQQAHVRPYTDSKTGRTGLHVTWVQDNSAATQFGLRKDDVILSINGTSVSSEEQAVNVVKQQLRQNQHYITVKILRYGQVVTKKYDTRDPATRRQAASQFGR